MAVWVVDGTTAQLGMASLRVGDCRSDGSQRCGVEALPCLLWRLGFGLIIDTTMALRASGHDTLLGVFPKLHLIYT